MESINKRVENVCIHSGNKRQWCVKVCPCAGFTVYTFAPYYSDSLSKD